MTLQGPPLGQSGSEEAGNSPRSSLPAPAGLPSLLPARRLQPAAVCRSCGRQGRPRPAAPTDTGAVGHLAAAVSARTAGNAQALGSCGTPTLRLGKTGIRTHGSGRSPHLLCAQLQREGPACALRPGPWLLHLPAAPWGSSWSPAMLDPTDTVHDCHLAAAPLAHSALYCPTLACWTCQLGG